MGNYLTSRDLVNFLNSQQLDSLFSRILSLVFFSKLDKYVSDEVKIKSSLLVSKIIIKRWFDPAVSEEEDKIKVIENIISTTYIAISIFVHFGNAIKDNQENSKIKQFQGIMDKNFKSSLDLFIKLRPHESVAGHSQLLSNTYWVIWSLYDSISTDFSSN
ncbi:hypothetical protein DICPUDRAFT_75534 [Dictyostelium purpureum]|uniref:Uncharacterized protein n=1 Tax=Dictyostelium purpureum TaxID=5786 RepID=F0ZAX9_DICPU|nr:uncharacterized protein DICPUDRAFT_75534 [Dictyostelium purpureum]EGC38907.1 hypothetical protein DICPUDRAFT_75534 [Dictyostelium purpureum]|eukprot:XP_003284587.1 hypothetical protein DICPUDRAFT_75534 [Dictyostelium purpureum]